MSAEINGNDNGERHVRFVNEISDSAAAKVVAKFTWFLVINAGALIAAIGTGINAYYSLEARESATRLQVEINTRRIDRMLDQDAQVRSQIEAAILELRREMKSDMGEIKRELRDHNNQTNGRR